MKQIVKITLAIGLGSVVVACPQAQTKAPAQPSASVMGMFDSGPPPAPPAPGAPLPIPKARIPATGPSLDLAYETAKAAILSCAGKPVGVAVVDQSAKAKLIYIPDGSVTDNAATAVRKANTALLIGAPRNQLYPRAMADKTLAVNPDYVIWGGGLPIVVKGEVIGAIGFSGVGRKELTTPARRHV